MGGTVYLDVIRGANAPSGSGGGGTAVGIVPGDGDGGGIDGYIHAGSAPGSTAPDPRGEGAVDLQRVRDAATQVASGESSFISGQYCSALGVNAHAEGLRTTAGFVGYSYRPSSHTEGSGTVATGNYGPHAEGYNTQAVGPSTHAEGYNTYAYGNSSHAEGSSTYAIGRRSHAEGSATYAGAQAAHAG